jgi:hypothetical protein
MFLQKHHYRELSEEAQQSLGEIPNKFIDYWTQRFPLLLLHTWITMQCVKNEPIFNPYYHKDYIFSHSLYVYGSKDVCTIYSSVTLPYTAKKGETQMLTEINEQQYFEQHNFAATKDGNMSPNVKRWHDRGGNRKEKSPKRFQNSGKDSHASKFENWRAADDPVRQLYQKLDLARARDDIYVNTTDDPRHLNSHQHNRGSPEKLVTWRDVGRQTDSKNSTVVSTDPDTVHRPQELQKTDISDVNPTEFATEDPLLPIVGYDKQVLSAWRKQDKQLNNDVRYRSAKKRHRHKSAEAPAVWMLPDSLPPKND